MSNVYSLKSLVDQMESDGRSFEEIQSFIREYKRRQQSQPVPDIVGVTMEDVPLEEFVAPEKPQLRYINYPQKNKKLFYKVILILKLKYEAHSLTTNLCKSYVDN